MNTLLLDVSAWDLTVDAKGNIAMASDPYALSQDVSSACRLFRGELWYDTAQGIPYFQKILGRFPPLNLMKQFYADAAMTVPGIVAAVCFLTGLVGRRLTGQVQTTDTAGVINSSGF